MKCLHTVVCCGPSAQIVHFLWVFVVVVVVVVVAVVVFCSFFCLFVFFFGFFWWWGGGGGLLNVPATSECISGTDLLRQVYVLPH